MNESITLTVSFGVAIILLGKETSEILTQQGVIAILVDARHSLLERLHEHPRRTHAPEIRHEYAGNVVLKSDTILLIQLYVETVVLFVVVGLDQREPGVLVVPERKHHLVFRNRLLHALEELAALGALLVLLATHDKLGVKVEVDATVGSVLQRAHDDAANHGVHLLVGKSPRIVDNVKRVLVLGHNAPAVTIWLSQVAQNVDDKLARRALVLLAKVEDAVLVDMIESLGNDRLGRVELETRILGIGLGALGCRRRIRDSRSGCRTSCLVPRRSVAIVAIVTIDAIIAIIVVVALL